jgi:ribosomal protein L32
MPIFTLLCTNKACGFITKQLVSHKDKDDVQCPKCETYLEPQLPHNLNTSTFEMRDPHRGKQLRKGHDGMMKERMKRYHDQYDVAEKIDKFGMDEALKNGWVKKR